MTNQNSTRQEIYLDFSRELLEALPASIEELVASVDRQKQARLEYKPKPNPLPGSKSIDPWLVLAAGASSSMILTPLVILIRDILRRPIVVTVTRETPILSNGQPALDSFGRAMMEKTTEQRVVVPATGNLQSKIEAKGPGTSVNVALESK